MSFDARAMIADIYELSPMQRAMLFQAEYSPQSAVNFNQFGCKISGPLKPGMFHQAWEKIVARHGILRTSFHWEGLDKPLQVVHKEVMLPWNYQDWRSLDRESVARKWQEHLLADQQVGFTLDRPPLRASLARIAGDEYLFNWSHHHILMDGWCLSLLLEEFFKTYEALASHKPLNLPPVPSYRTYIEWLQRQNFDEAREYWTRYLEGVRAATELPVCERLSGKTNDRELLEGRLSERLSQSLQRLAQQHQITPNIIIQGVWALLLARYSGERDIVFGATVSGRPADLPNVGRMLGLFINTIPVRVSVQAEASLVEWLKGIQARQAGRSRYEFAPLFDIQKWSNLPSGTPLFNSNVIFMNYPLDESLVRGASGLVISEPRIYDHTDAWLQLQATAASEWMLDLTFDTSRFEPGTIRRMLGHLQTLLEGFVQDPTRRLGSLPLLTAREQHQLFTIFNNTSVPLAGGETFVERFEAGAAAAPGRIVVACEERSLNWEQLNQGANRVARQLLALCRLQADDLVCVLLRRTERMMASVLGVWKSGAAYVPLEADYPESRILRVIRESGAKLVITETGLLSSELESKLEELAPEVKVLKLDQLPVAGDGTNLKLKIGAEQLAYVIYTSGSTGQPKGVMVEHGGMLNHLLAKVSELELTRESVIAQNASHCFDISVWQFFAGPLVGGKTVIYGDEVVLEPERFLEGVAAEQVSVLEVVPSYLGVLLEQKEEQRELLSQLQYLVVTGEVVSRRLVERWFEEFAIPVINAYGPTEASDDITHYRMTAAGRGTGGTGVVPVGKPVQNLRIYIVDEQLNLCPVGVKGEICVSGVGVGRGYLHDEAKTRAVFLDDPFQATRGERGVRMYRTGDVGCYLPDGNIVLSGRKDHQVKIRGHRIELGEIENALTQLDYVQQAVALDFQDQTGYSAICGYVTLKPGAKAGEAILAEALAEKLPDYMVPAAFVVLDKLPLTQNGKIDRKALPAPNSAKESGKTSYRAPTTPAEQALCQIWSEVLGVSQPGVDDNFFALGGDSILSMQIVSRAGRAGLKLLTGQVFEHQTIAALARVATPIASRARETGAIQGPVPLTPIQQRFFLQHKPEPHHYNQSVMIEVPANVDAELLNRALQQVTSHHDAPNLRFHRDGRNWFQQIANTPAPILAVEDLSALSVAAQRLRVEAIAAQTQAGLNLSEGPLLRAVLFQSGGEQKPLLLLVAHHLVIDGVSWRILLESLSLVYQQLRANEAVRLPDKTTTFTEWATLMAEAVKANVELDRQYWQALASASPTALPLDSRVPLEANTVGSAAEITTVLNEEKTAALLQQVSAAYNTQINDLLLAALGLTLREWTGNEQILIDLEGHGREPWIENTDLSLSIGWFTTLYPVLLHVSDDDPATLIKSVKECLREVPSRGLTYGVLRYLTDDAVVGAAPAAQIVFNYLGQLDQVLPGASEWKLASMSTGSDRSATQQREYLLEVNSYVRNGCLHTTWGFSRKLHKEATLRELADSYNANLERLIEHCLHPAAFGFTPSDFPAAGISQASLDGLAQKFSASGQQSPRTDVEDIYELTPTQQGMLFHGLYAPDSEAYFTQLTCLLEGDLDPTAFLAAWQQTVRRHSILRSSFHWEALEKPVQVVHREVALPWQNLDLSTATDAEAIDFWNGEMQQSRTRGFSISEAPLMRWTIAWLGHSRWRFNWSQHHLLLDGWSTSLVLGEVLETYAALCAGRTAELARPLPFREMVSWLQRRDEAGSRQFWKEKLADFSTPTALVLGRPEMEGKRGAELSAEEEIFVSDDFAAKLTRFAQDSQLSLNTLAQGAWSILLSRYSGETDVVYGTIVSGRPPDLEGANEMVGLFINTVPVRVQIEESEPVLSWLRQLQTSLVEQDQHTYCSLAEIQSWSELPGGTPLFESLLIFQNYPVQEVLNKPITGVRISEFQVFDPNNYPLTLVVAPGETLCLRVLYDAGRFDRETIVRLLGHYQTILEGMVAAPAQPLRQIDPLTASERAQLTEWNQTSVPVPTDKTVVDLFEAHAANTPDRIAVLCGDSSRTYRELSERSTALARHLLHVAAVEPDDRIVIFMPRSERMVETILAIWKCGAAYVPIDPNYPAARIEQILAGAQPRLIVAESIAALAHLPGTTTIVSLDSVSFSAAASRPLPSRAAPHGLAYVIYTSGSTGSPKGAMVEHRGMLNHILGMIRDLELTAESAVAETASHCFDISVWQFFAALISGGRTVIYPDQVVRQPVELAGSLERDGITAVQLVPSYLAAFMDELRSAQPRPSLSPLRFMVTIGEILKQSYVREWFELYPNVKMMNAYGPTEASDSITHFIMDRPSKLRSIPVGRPVQNLKVYVLDKLGRLCPIGVRGEICVAGVGVGRGYLFDEQRTAAVFEPDLFETAASGEILRRYHTGDYGCYAPDGNLLFFGRKDFQVKIRGHRIELGDVEAAIAGLDGINNAAVVDRENASGGKYLCAYVSQSEAANWSAVSLRNAMKQKLPDHMLPDTWAILPELPVTPNGKVNRKALPEPAGESRALPLYEPPATSREKAVAAIWEEVLARQVGIDDNFFEIGGHSLRAVQIVSRIRRNLGIDVTLQQLFTLPTVRALTADLSNSSAYKTSRITALPDAEWYAVSHAQKRIWLACRAAGASIAYNMASAFRLEGPLNVAALVAALQALVERHESLRTVFAFVNGELKQKVQSSEANRFEVAMIGAPPALDDFIAREAELPFDLARGPLFRATVARLAADNNILLLTMHHLISDAWSVNILIKELRSLYDAFNSGKAFPLAPLPIQGRDYAAWHNRLLESEETQAHREYWQDRLSGDMPRLELPVDYPRTAAQGSNGGRLASSVDENVAWGLAALAQRRGTSLFGAVLASITVLLYRYTGQQDLVVGLQSTGRDRQELEDQVGAYLNTVVLRASLEPGLSLGETVSSLGAVLLEALDHSAYPFDLLLEDLRPRTPAHRSPIFDVQIDYVPDLDSASSVDSGNSVGASLGLAITDLSQDTARTKYDLSFLILETSQRLEIITVYNADLFRRETIERMHERLAVIQKAFLENEAMTISDVELSGEAQQANPRVRVGLRLGKNKQESAAGELVG